MTELLTEGGAAPPEPDDLTPAGDPVCAYEGCTNTFPADARRGRMYCDEHLGGRPRARNPRGPRQGPRDKAPPQVRVTVGGPTPRRRDPALAAAEKRAGELLGLLSAILLISGLHADATTVETVRPRMAAATANLAEYEEWLLRLLAQGGQDSGRVVAWVEFLSLFFGGLALPILANHDKLPEPIAHALGLLGQQMADDGAGQSQAA